MEKIFISIASYRDPDLINTIKDAYDKANYPERIVFGVLFQGEVSELNEFLSNSVGYNINLKYYPIEDSKGTGWARNILTKDMLLEEEYWLQIDSHMRFRHGWDSDIINFYQFVNEDCMLSAYPPHFGLEESYDEYVKREFNNRAIVKEFTEMFSFRDTKGRVPELSYEESITASGAFQFANNKVAKSVTFDEYFNPWMDQEITSCLCYMNGYNIYAPREAVIWHCYYDNHIGSDKKWRDLVADDKQINGYEIYPFETIKKLNTKRTWQQWHDRVVEDIKIKKDW